MSASWWQRLALRRMNLAAKRRTLHLESLEDRTTPAGIFATTPNIGGAPIVTVYDANTNQVKFPITAYDGSFTGGVNVAIGDVNGDGTPDVITGAGTGGGSDVKVFSGIDGTLLKTFTIGDSNTRSGASVAAADFDGDGAADIVIGTIRNGQPIVQVLKFADGSALHGYTPFAGATGVTVAAGDVNRDGTPDVVVGSGGGISSQVVVFNGKNDETLYTLPAFGGNFLGAVNVAAGDLNGDGNADIIAAAGDSGGPRVQVFSGLTGLVIQNFFAYDSAERNGAIATAADGDGNGTVDIVTVDGPGRSMQLKGFDARTLASLNVLPLPGLPVATSYDNQAPATSLTSTRSGLTNQSPIPYQVQFSEGVNGFSLDGISITNGVASNLVRVDGKTFTFDVTPTADGIVSVSVKARAATDAAGNSSEAAGPARITYDTTGPTVTETPLTTNSTTPTIRGTIGSDASSVSVTVGGQTVLGVISGTTWSATIPTALSAGQYTVQVIAKDALGNSTTVSQANGLVIDIAPPTILSVTSPTADGTYTTGNAVDVTVKFSEPVTVTGTPVLALNSGGTAQYLSGTGTDTLTFRYTIATGQSSTDLDYVATTSLTLPTGAAITDAATNAATLTLPAPGSPESLGGSKAIVVDAASPTVTVSSSAPSSTATSPIPFTVTFSKVVTGFTDTDLTVVHGVATQFNADPDGKTFTFVVTPDDQGNVSVSVPAAVAQDSLGNGNLASNVLTINYDSIAPAAPTILGLTLGTDTGSSSTDGITSNTRPTLTGSAETGAVVSLTIDEGNGPISLGNATREGGNWVLTIGDTLTSGTYIITAKATDAAGNVSTVSSPYTLVVDTVAPTVDVSTTASDPADYGNIPITVVFSEAPVGFTNASVSVSSGIIANFVASQDGKTFTFDAIPPSTGGTLTVSVAAGATTDVAGNPNVASNVISLTVNPANPASPTTTVSTSAPSSTATSPIPFTVTFSKVVTGFTDTDLTVVHGVATQFNADPDGKTFTFVVTPDDQGNVSVSVGPGVAQDSSNNGNIASNVLTVNYDTVAPAAPIITGLTPATDTGSSNNDGITSNTQPTLTGTAEIDAIVSLTINNGNGPISLGNATRNGNSWSLTVGAMLSNGTYAVTATATDAAGNVSAVSSPFALVVDTAPPTVAVSTTASNPADYGAIPVTVAFSEVAVGFTQSALSVSGGTVENFVASQDGKTFTFDVIPPATGGTVTVSVAASAATDLAGNPNLSSNELSLTVNPADATSPTTTVSTSAPSSTATSPIPFTVTFSKVVTGFTDTDLTVVHGVATQFNADPDGKTFTFVVTPDDQGNVSVSVGPGVAQDSSNNGNIASNVLTVNYDTVAPAAPIITGLTPATDTGSSNNDGITSNTQPTLTGTAEIDAIVSLTINNGNGPISLGNATRNGNSWSLTIGDTLTSGTYTITAKATDAAGNVSLVSSPFTLVVDTVAPTVAVSTTASDPAPYGPVPITVAFNEVPVGFTQSALSVSGGTVENFAAAPDGKTFTFDVVPPIEGGTVTVSVAAAVATDVAGNPNEASNVLTLTVNPTTPSP